MNLFIKAFITVFIGLLLVSLGWVIQGKYHVLHDDTPIDSTYIKQLQLERDSACRKLQLIVLSSAHEKADHEQDLDVSIHSMMMAGDAMENMMKRIDSLQALISIMKKPGIRYLYMPAKVK